MLGTTKPEQGFATLDDVAQDIARSRQMESFALTFRGYHRGMQGAFAEARRMCEEAIAISGSLGLRFDLSAHNEELGHLEHYAGDTVACERAFRKNYDILDEAGDEGHKSTAAASLALALCDLERYDEAETYAEMAMRIGAEDDLATQSPGRSARARVLAARGEFDEAERLAREAVGLFAEAETPNFQGDAWMHLAEVQLAAGKSDEAERAAREALSLYERKGNRPGAALAQAFIDEC
jgi:tetratricopeptide (TPR) repeat protein